MSREQFEANIRLFPHELIHEMKLHAAAEFLTEKMVESLA